MRDHQSYFGEDIQNLGESCALGLSLVGAGTSEQVSVFDSYIDRLRKNIDFGDFLLSGTLETELPVGGRCSRYRYFRNTQNLFTDVDGRFPNHHPNPVDPDTLKLLNEQVHSAGANAALDLMVMAIALA